MIQFKNHGTLYNRGEVAGEAMPLGTFVKLDSTGTKLMKAGDGERGLGFLYQEARALSVGDNAQIWDSSYDEGLLGTYNAKRPYNKWTIRNVGDAIAVTVEKGTIISDYDLYTGTVAPQDMLGAGPSGLLKKVTEHDLAVAQVMVGGVAGTDKITIVQL